jgi:nucleotide-binding universal stress UspA family protein
MEKENRVPVSARDVADVATRSERQAESRLSRIVVGYDGSDSANAAAAFTLWLAGKAGCEATVVHASPTPETVASADLLTGAAEQVVAYERKWQLLLENLRAYAAEGAVVDDRVVRGTPAGVLVAAALESNADLVVVGSHGVSCLPGALIGSVSSEVLDHAPCSVMVFREVAAATPAKQAVAIVVGVDGSPSSRHALELAQALAVPLGARLVLVHAYNPHIPFAVMTTTGMRDMLRRHGQELLDAAREAVTTPLEIVSEAVEGPARQALVDACERHAPALLMVGSRGLGGFKGLLLGSTSRWVVNHAQCPVLVARTSALPE